MIEHDESIKSGGFSANLPEGFQEPTDAVGKRILMEYGAVLVARGGAKPPREVIFHDASAVASFQSSLKSSRETIGPIAVELQEPAMRALLAAIAEASKSGLSITPRGVDAAKRDYDDTVTLWKSRVDPALTHWLQAGRISPSDAQRIRSLTPIDQVAEVFRLEEQGLYFSKDFSKSIIYSVAPPGASQHLTLLALDVTEHDNAKVRGLLATYGWYQTVVSDLPHFTFLGVPEDDLPKLGLKRSTSDGRQFWIPDL